MRGRICRIMGGIGGHLLELDMLQVLRCGYLHQNYGNKFKKYYLD